MKRRIGAKRKCVDFVGLSDNEYEQDRYQSLDDVVSAAYIILKLDNFYALEWTSAAWKLMF